MTKILSKMVSILDIGGFWDPKYLRLLANCLAMYMEKQWYFTLLTFEICLFILDTLILKVKMWAW